MTTIDVSKKIRTRKATAETRSRFKFTQTKLEQSLFYRVNLMIAYCITNMSIVKIF